MKIMLTVGHSILKNGNCTSADGRPFGGILEYAYNKNIIGHIAGYLREAGHTVDVLVCPERKFIKSTEEKAYKLPKANRGGYNLVAELHLNASGLHNARGCEVLYITEKGMETAKRIHERLATVFKGRGIQKRPELYMLNATVPTAVMIESFFCDNKEDCALAEKEDVALLIAEGIHGGKIGSGQPNQPDSPKPIYHVQTGAFSLKQNAEQLKMQLKAQGFDAIIMNARTDQQPYRVQVGAYNNKENAQAMERRLKEAGFDSLIVAI